MEELNLTMEQRRSLLDVIFTCERNLQTRVARILQKNTPITPITLETWNKDIDLLIQTLEFVKKGMNDTVKM